MQPLKTRTHAHNLNTLITRVLILVKFKIDSKLVTLLKWSRDPQQRKREKSKEARKEGRVTRPTLASSELRYTYSFFSLSGVIDCATLFTELRNIVLCARLLLSSRWWFFGEKLKKKELKRIMFCMDEVFFK